MTEARRRRTPKPHPAREAILDVMRQYGKPISPTQLARIAGITLGSTAYHVRVLLAAEVIELAGEKRVRGAIEHLYALVDAHTELGAASKVRQLLSLCGALTVPGSKGGFPLASQIDDEARSKLEALLAVLRSQVQEIAVSSTTRVGQKPD